MKNFALGVCVFLFSFCVLAKPRVKIVKKKDRIVYKKNTIINFNESIVDGELIKPKGGYLQLSEHQLSREVRRLFIIH